MTLRGVVWPYKVHEDCVAGEIGAVCRGSDGVAVGSGIEVAGGSGENGLV